MLTMKKALEGFLSDRILEFNKRTPEIDEYEDEIKEIRGEIFKLVPCLYDKVWKLLDELESNEIAIAAIREDLAYKQGIKDGVSLKKYKLFRGD